VALIALIKKKARISEISPPRRISINQRFRNENRRPGRLFNLHFVAKPPLRGNLIFDI